MPCPDEDRLQFCSDPLSCDVPRGNRRQVDRAQADRFQVGRHQADRRLSRHGADVSDVTTVRPLAARRAPLPTGPFPDLISTGGVSDSHTLTTLQGVAACPGERQSLRRCDAGWVPPVPSHAGLRASVQAGDRTKSIMARNILAPESKQDTPV